MKTPITAIPWLRRLGGRFLGGWSTWKSGVLTATVGLMLAGVVALQTVVPWLEGRPATAGAVTATLESALSLGLTAAGFALLAAGSNPLDDLEDSGARRESSDPV